MQNGSNFGVGSAHTANAVDGQDSITQHESRTGRTCAGLDAGYEIASKGPGGTLGRRGKEMYDGRTKMREL